jgi:signal transduction histidine kinase/DNA-binding response OmpR family regulator
MVANLNRNTPANLADAPPSVPSSVPPLILATDDDDAVRLMLCRALEMEGYRVISTRNGAECLEAFHAHQPDMVLLDAIMPEMDGFTCCAELSALPECQFTPILMVTSLNDRESVDRAFAAGATDYVTKPIHWAVLRQRVRRLLEQARLHRQVQQFNSELETMIEACNTEARQRNLQLQRALEFEATLKRITDKVRDSLDEDQILQTAVRELAWAVNVGCCNAAVYDLENRSSRVWYEYSASITGYQGQVIAMDSCPEIYHQLLNGQYFQFCSLNPNPNRGRVAMFACPMINSDDTVGDLWLVSPAERALDDLEIRLLEQVANQCAIAIRQARLYHEAQIQVKELARLNHLKDDFLSTVSHELRSPMSNMRMAIQMLEHDLKDNTGNKTGASKKSAAYLKILRDECEREIGLINDLLDLQRLEAGQQSLNLDAIQLQEWLPAIVNPFKTRAQERQQSLRLRLSSTPQSFVTDPTCLRRVLVELLTNACKYTPPGGNITVTAAFHQTGKLETTCSMLVIVVTNSGIEIPAIELPRIFDKFYRIPSGDPWKQGGTGLGLALIKRLVAHLSGTIQVKSGNGKTSFTVQLPAIHTIPQTGGS